MSAYTWAHFVPIVHPFICRYVQLNMKLLSVSLNFRKLIVILDGIFFCFSGVLTALRLSLLKVGVKSE